MMRSALFFFVLSSSACWLSLDFGDFHDAVDMAVVVDDLASSVDPEMPPIDLAVCSALPDPSTLAWTREVDNLLGEFFEPSPVTLPGRRLLFIGGRDGAGIALATIFELKRDYDAIAPKPLYWVSFGMLPAAQGNAWATLTADGNAVLLGGFPAGDEIVIAPDGGVAHIGPAPLNGFTRRYITGGLGPDGLAYFLGGETGSGPTPQVFRRDSVGMWTTSQPLMNPPPMPYGVLSAAVAAVQGDLWVMGGQTQDFDLGIPEGTNACARYVKVESAWKTCLALPRPARTARALRDLAGRLIVLSPEQDTDLFGGRMYFYDECAKTWREGPRIPGPSGMNTAGVGFAGFGLGPDGRIYGAGTSTGAEVLVYGPRVKLAIVSGSKTVFGGPFSPSGHVSLRIGSVTASIAFSADADMTGALPSPGMPGAITLTDALAPSGTELWITDDQSGFIVVATVP